MRVVVEHIPIDEQLPIEIRGPDGGPSIVRFIGVIPGSSSRRFEFSKVGQERELAFRLSSVFPVLLETKDRNDDVLQTVQINKGDVLVPISSRAVVLVATNSDPSQAEISLYIF